MIKDCICTENISLNISGMSVGVLDLNECKYLNVEAKAKDIYQDV